MGLLQELQSRILTADGAMGTLLYSYGLSSCHEEMNVTKPDIVKKIHEQYIAACADIIQTNTYGANRIKLEKYGLQHDVVRLNEAAVRIAKEAAKGKNVFVLGTIGGIRTLRGELIDIASILAAVGEQLQVFIEQGVDGILFETYYDFEEIEAVVKFARSQTNLPIIAQVSMQEPGILQGGISFNDALKKLQELGADVVGANCYLGPFHTIQAFEKVELPEEAFLSAYPNASLLDLEEGRVVYESEAEYFARAAEQLVKQGVRLIGGCCGTTPKHIEATKKMLSHLQPVEEKSVNVETTRNALEPKPRSEEPLHEKVKRERSIIVELDTPRYLEIDEFVKGAKKLYEGGADVIMMADNSLASPRISNIAMSAILQREGVRVLPHLTCRDRNLIGLQSHLMGLDALGLHDLLVVTGDPTKIGDFPGATSVYDVTSMELMAKIKEMNKGISFSGKPLRKACNFSVAGAFNPNVRVVAKAVDRLRKKLEHGCDYFISQPVYTKEKIQEVYEATKDLNAPVYIGIMPLTSFRSAEFLHFEVPGIKLSDEVLERMKEAGDDKVKAAQTGIEIAKELIDVAATLFNGIYLITPFLRYDVTLELIKYIQQLDEAKERENHYA